MKNCAGNNVSIFLFQFVLQKNAVSFVLNESIAEDMYQDIEEQMQPLVHACGETLMRYRHLCNESVIMDGNIIEEGCFEVMLSKGLGKHFAEKEKQNLFNDANEISDLLTEVMNKRTKEMERGIYTSPHPVTPKIQRTQSTSKGLEALGRKHELLDELAVFDIETDRLRKLKPDDLPYGVIARKGYDHRGHCYAFEHVTLGDLGKIILIDMEENTRIEAELCNGNSGVLSKKQKVFEEVISIIERGLRQAVI